MQKKILIITGEKREQLAKDISLAFENTYVVNCNEIEKLDIDNIFIEADYKNDLLIIENLPTELVTNVVTKYFLGVTVEFLDCKELINPKIVILCEKFDLENKGVSIYRRVDVINK